MNGALSEGIALYKEGRFLQALDFLEILNPEEEPEALYYLALTYTRLGNWRKGLEHLDSALNSEGNFLKVLQIRMVRTFVLTQLGSLDEAEKELKALMAEGVESPQVYSQYGYVLWAMGRGKEGTQWLNKALKRNPDNPTALNSLGYILAEEGLLLDKAVSLCQKAVTLDPANPLYLDSLGWAYHRSGQKKLAEFYLKQAAELAPQNKEIKRHLKAVQELIK